MRKDWKSANHICNLIYSTYQVTCKSDPGCLRLTEIVASCKYIISDDIAKNTVTQESKGAFCLGYVFRKIGKYEQRGGENFESIHKHNGWLCGRIPNQVGSASLEWTQWGKYLIMAEFAKTRSGNGDREEMAVVETNGGLKAADAVDSISLTQSQETSGKLPYFIKVPKIREIISRTEGLCEWETYMVWRNNIYAGVWDGDVFGEARRLLPINGLGGIDQFLWVIVFETSSQNQHPAVTEMQLSLSNPRLVIELLPRFKGGWSSNDEPVPKKPKRTPKSQAKEPQR